MNDREQVLAVGYERSIPSAIAFGVLTGVGLAVMTILFVLAIRTLDFVLGALDVVVLGLFLLGLYETFALATGSVPPITWLARRSERKSPFLWMAVVFCTQTFAGLLAGHFFWSSCPVAPFG